MTKFAVLQWRILPVVDGEIEIHYTYRVFNSPELRKCSKLVSVTGDLAEWKRRNSPSRKYEICLLKWRISPYLKVRNSSTEKAICLLPVPPQCSSFTKTALQRHLLVRRRFSSFLDGEFVVFWMQAELHDFAYPLTMQNCHFDWNHSPSVRKSVCTLSEDKIRRFERRFYLS